MSAGLAEYVGNKLSLRTRLSEAYPDTLARLGISDVCVEAFRFQAGDGSMWTGFLYPLGRPWCIRVPARVPNGNAGQQHTEETK